MSSTCIMKYKNAQSNHGNNSGLFVSSAPPYMYLLAFMVITANLSLGELLWNCPHSVPVPCIVRHTSAGGVPPLQSYRGCWKTRLCVHIRRDSFIGSLYNWLYSFLYMHSECAFSCGIRTEAFAFLLCNLFNMWS